MALVASALLVTVQLASAQITPRIIGMVYRNAYLKWGLALFVFTFTFSIGVLVRIDETVPRVAYRFGGLWLPTQPRALRFLYRWCGENLAAQFSGPSSGPDWSRGHQQHLPISDSNRMPLRRAQSRPSATSPGGPCSVRWTEPCSHLISKDWFHWRNDRELSY